MSHPRSWRRSSAGTVDVKGERRRSFLIPGQSLHDPGVHRGLLAGCLRRGRRWRFAGQWRRLLLGNRSIKEAIMLLVSSEEHLFLLMWLLFVFLGSYLTRQWGVSLNTYDGKWPLLVTWLHCAWCFASMSATSPWLPCSHGVFWHLSLHTWWALPWEAWHHCLWF